MILDKIVNSTKLRLQKEKEVKSFEQMKKEALALPLRAKGFFKNALEGKAIKFICEVKKASPSKGLICADFNHKKIAADYEKYGAAAISVLTEEKNFLGSNECLQDISEIVSIPILRKDFIVDPYQIYQAHILGASAILLICAILSLERLKEFKHLADSLNLDCLVEAHDEKELAIALEAGAEIIGVNNRNLKDFSVDFNNTLTLRKLAPPDKIFVSESGIKTREDIEALQANKVNAVLIGETLMRSGDIGKTLRHLNGS
ncbi:MAG: indole-3-glycerol phosphate synthase TrpC [Elusimicrobiota bacterium]|jgi:indole-3-glycerol phosphate synthase|nr:indole-3-glycerol phosphate synthase TrpC [Elusimicrobiota bacterium]